MSKYEFITRKQAGVIFANYKAGKIAADKEQIDYLYKEIVGRSLGDMSQCMDAQAIQVYTNYRAILKAIFENDFEKANFIFEDGLNGDGFWSYDSFLF